MLDAAPPSAYVYEISGEALYWTAREQGMALAIQEGKVIRPAFKTHLGFRLGALFPLNRDAWQLGATFTHFHARNRLSLEGDLLPIWPHPALIQASNSLQTMWRLHMGFGDLFLTRKLCLNLAPIFGFRGAGVRFKTLYDYGAEELSMKNKFWGIGPRIGVEGTCWIFYARGSTSTLYGQFYLHQDDEIFRGEKQKFKNLTYGLTVMNEMALGLNLDWSCFSLRASWELLLLPYQGQWAQFVSAEMPAKMVSHLGGLVMQGLSLGIIARF